MTQLLINAPVRTESSELGCRVRLLEETSYFPRRSSMGAQTSVLWGERSSYVLRPMISDFTKSHVVVCFPEAPAERDPIYHFRQEKAAFDALFPTLAPQFDGRFVAVHDGIVVDADVSREVLVRRFFEQFGDVSVYIGYVGERRPIAYYQVTPFRL